MSESPSAEWNTVTQLFSEVKPDQMQITMATEAQRLIGISLTKIAQSRAHRGGVSLHKNLLVATVLQKARYIFMEEAYHMVHTGSYCPPPTPVPTPVQEFEHQSYDEDALVALTPEEAGISSSPLGPEETSFQEFLQPSCVRLSDEPAKDKENSPPPAYQTHASELTYLDLDRSNSILRERGQQQQQQSTETGSTTCLKRRRAVTEWETEEAVLSILPKRSKPEPAASEPEEEGDDSVFLDEATLFSDCVSREVEAERTQETNNGSSAMEIDRITSLVSIFSFGNLAVNGASCDGLGKLSRSVSTPDLCSAQAKESVDALQQRPFLAMTV